MREKYEEEYLFDCFETLMSLLDKEYLLRIFSEEIYVIGKIIWPIQR